MPDDMPLENIEYTRKGQPMLTQMEPKHPLSLSQVFEDSADPETIIQYARYRDEPQIVCRSCSNTEKLSRIPYQNSCKQCQVKGLEIVFFVFCFYFFGCFLLGMGMN